MLENASVVCQQLRASTGRLLCHKPTLRAALPPLMPGSWASRCRPASCRPTLPSALHQRSGWQRLWRWQRPQHAQQRRLVQQRLRLHPAPLSLPPWRKPLLRRQPSRPALRGSSRRRLWLPHLLWWQQQHRQLSASASSQSQSQPHPRQAQQAARQRRQRPHSLVSSPRPRRRGASPLRRWGPPLRWWETHSRCAAARQGSLCCVAMTGCGCLQRWHAGAAGRLPSTSQQAAREHICCIASEPASQQTATQNHAVPTCPNPAGRPGPAQLPRAASQRQAGAAHHR